MNRSTLAAACLVTSLGAAPGAVSALTWELVGVSFNDNTSVTGTFEYNGVGSCNSHSITVLAGSGFSDYTYIYPNGPPNDQNFSDCVDASRPIPSAIFVAFPSGSQSRVVQLVFALPLTNAGGLVDLVPTESFECNNCGPLFRHIVGGAVLAQVVPEPGSWALFGLGLAVLGISWRRECARSAGD